MWIFLDDDFALMVIRRQIERAYRHVVALGREPDEAEKQRALDKWSVKALALIEQKAPDVFRNAQAQLITDVALKVIDEMLRQTKKRDDRGVYSPADLPEMRLLSDVRKNLSNLAKTRHNEIIGIPRGRRPGKKDAKPRKKRATRVDRKKILAAMRKIGQEPIYRKDVARILGVSVKTLGVSKDEWEILIAEALSTGSEK